MRYEYKVLIVGVLLIGAVLVGAYSFGLFNSRETTSQTTLPTTSTNTQDDGWREQTVPNIGLSLRIPPDMTYRGELAEQVGLGRTLKQFYLTTTSIGVFR